MTHFLLLILLGRLRKEQLEAELPELKARCQQQELEISNLENQALRQRFQEKLDNMLSELLQKEQEVFSQITLLIQSICCTDPFLTSHCLFCFSIKSLVMSDFSDCIWQINKVSEAQFVHSPCLFICYSYCFSFLSLTYIDFAYLRKSMIALHPPHLFECFLVQKSCILYR